MDNTDYQFMAWAKAAKRRRWLGPKLFLIFCIPALALAMCVGNSQKQAATADTGAAAPAPMTEEATPPSDLYREDGELCKGGLGCNGGMRYFKSWDMRRIRELAPAQWLEYKALDAKVQKLAKPVYQLAMRIEGGQDYDCAGLLELTAQIGKKMDDISYAQDVKDVHVTAAEWSTYCGEMKKFCDNELQANHLRQSNMEFLRGKKDFIDWYREEVVRIRVAK